MIELRGKSAILAGVIVVLASLFVGWLAIDKIIVHAAEPITSLQQGEDPAPLVLDQNWTVDFHNSPRAARGCFTVYSHSGASASSAKACVNYTGSTFVEANMEIEESAQQGPYQMRYTVLLNANTGYRVQVTVPVGEFDPAAVPSIGG